MGLKVFYEIHEFYFQNFQSYQIIQYFHLQKFHNNNYLLHRLLKTYFVHLKIRQLNRQHI